jgi:hypothetical protein
VVNPTVWAIGPAVSWAHGVTPLAIVELAAVDFLMAETPTPRSPVRGMRAHEEPP